MWDRGIQEIVDFRCGLLNYNVIKDTYFIVGVFFVQILNCSRKKSVRIIKSSVKK